MFKVILEQSALQQLNVQSLLDILSGRARYLVAFILSLPFCLPIQIPGFSTPFGIILSIIGLEIIFQRRFWMPKIIMEKQLSHGFLTKIARGGLWLNKKMKPYIHQRLPYVCYHIGSNVLVGGIITFAGLILALPLPIPFTNLAAAWPVFLICLGLLEDDGLLVLLGYILACMSLAFFILLIFIVKAAVF